MRPPPSATATVGDEDTRRLVTACHKQTIWTKHSSLSVITPAADIHMEYGHSSPAPRALKAGASGPPQSPNLQARSAYKAYAAGSLG